MTQVLASEIVFNTQLKQRAKIVYLYLSQRSNKENTCFPAIKTIANACGISVSTTKRALNDLVEVGLVEKETRYRNNNSQTSNLYKLSEVAKNDKTENENTENKKDNNTKDTLNAEIKEVISEDITQKKTTNNNMFATNSFVVPTSLYHIKTLYKKHIEKISDPPPSS